MKLSELASLLGGKVVSANEDFEVQGISTLAEAKVGDISFVSDKKFLREIPGSSASAVLISEKLGAVDCPHIPLKDVWTGVLTTLKLFYPDFARKTYEGIHPSAVVDASAELGVNVNIGPLAVVGPNAKVGSNCYIGPGAVVGAECEIGEGSTIYANAVLEAGTRLGRGVFVQPGAVIGADGFKYEMLKGRWTKIPQVGHVELGDDVEVGANTCIDRASYTVTSVGPNTKLDNLVQIAHNAHVGGNCVIVSQSGIAGSTTLGDNSIMAAQAGIADNLKVGNNVVILGQSGVKNDVKDGETWFGSPAMPFRQRARVIAVEGKLPDMAAELTRLVKRVEELEARLKERDES